MRRPKPVQFSRNATAAASAANSSSGTGPPSPAPFPSTLIAWGKPSIAAPPLSATAIPVKIKPVPRVARIGGMPIAAIASPLQRPPSAPVASRAATPSAIAGRAPGACGAGATSRITSTASIEARLARPITDRSMPPVSIETITASPSSANSGNWNAIEEKLARLKNNSGCAALMPANTSSVISASRPRLVPNSRPGQRGAARRGAAWSLMPPSPRPRGGEPRAQRRHAGAEQDQRAGDHVLPRGRNAEHDQAVVDHHDQRDAEQRAEDRAVPAAQPRAPEHD